MASLRRRVQGSQGPRRRRGEKVAIYEAGSCQERVGVDWFTHLFEIPRGRGLHSVNTWSQSTVRRGLIQEHEFFLTQAICELSVSSIVPNLSLPTRDLTSIQGGPLVFPLVLTAAITAAGPA